MALPSYLIVDQLRVNHKSPVLRTNHLHFAIPTVKLGTCLEITTLLGQSSNHEVLVLVRDTVDLPRQRGQDFVRPEFSGLFRWEQIQNTTQVTPEDREQLRCPEGLDFGTLDCEAIDAELGLYTITDFTA
jgi:hypothetical protein